MENRYYIYKHIRPDKDEVFYIGIGKEGTDRINHKRRNSIWKNIFSLNNGEIEKYKIAENLSLEEANKIEILLIDYYGRIKYNTGTLANILKGGHDNKDYRKMTKEDKSRLRSKMLGNTYSKGKRSEEVRFKMSISRKGRSTAKKGQKASLETKKRMSESHKGNKSIFGKIWINNGKEKKLILNTESIPENWYRGRNLININ